MINCPSCRTQLKPAGINTGGFEPCPLCGQKLRVEAFPAVAQAPEEVERAETLMDDQAGCFFHPDKRATTVCDVCGRFVCALCDLDIHGAHMCPHCLETGQKEQSIANIENSRTLYDNVALSISIFSWPFLFVWLSGFSAPFVFYYIIRYWNAPTSIVGRSKIRFVLAGLNSLLQVAVSVFLFYSVFTDSF